MGDERRQHERHPSFETIKMVAREKDGRERTINVVLRDRSHIGLGGVYVGDDALNMNAAYYFNDFDGSVKRARLVWLDEVFQYVYLLGFLVPQE